MNPARPLASVALGLAALVAPVAVHAQPADAADPVVLVVDGEADRLAVPELVTELERALGRPVVRATDPAAASARTRITIAFAAPSRWLVRVDGAGVHATRSARLRASDLDALCALVSDAALEVAGTEETAGASDPWDPFASTRAPRVTVAFTGALIDPFTLFGGAMRVLGSPDVVDPWP